MKTNKQTRKNIKYFKRCVKHYIALFNLASYQWDIKGVEDAENRASVWHHSVARYPDASPRQFDVHYSIGWLGREDLHRKEIRTTAYHEVCEAFLYMRLTSLALAPDVNVSEREVDDCVHSGIRTLENTVLKYLPKP